MKVVILDEADAELTAAADWYEQERMGLGDDLLAEAARVVEAIAASPATWPVVPGSKIVRRFLFTRFPYVAYSSSGTSMFSCWRSATPVESLVTGDIA